MADVQATDIERHYQIAEWTVFHAVNRAVVSLVVNPGWSSPRILVSS